MSEKKARIMNAKDSTANWNSTNPTLLDGELGFEVKSNREVSMKVGDGATDWKNLKSAYCTPSEVDEKVGKAEKSLQSQINNIVLSGSETGNVAAEVIQARTDASGTTHSNLKERLDLADNGIATLKKGLSTKAENGDVTNISKTVSTLSQNVTNLTQTKANSADVYTKKEVDSKTVVDSSLNKDSNNAISNKAVSMMLQGVNSEISGLNKVKADASTTVTHTADTAVGHSTQPVYITSDGTVKECTCTLGKSVPAGAKFTDTTYSVVTTSKDGLMSSADKAKLDGIATGANHIIVDDKFSETSGNPISNRAVTNNIQKNLAGFAAADVEIKDSISHIKSDLNTKVDIVEGKGLSTNDYTTAEKNKLAGIATGANKTIVDSALSTTSTNPVQSKVIAGKIGTIEANISAAATTAGNAAASAAAVKKDLVNYYKKTETYSQTEINNKISAIPKFDIKVCEALPDSNISKTTVYLLKSPKEETNNLYDEYIYVNSKWEKLGTQTVGDVAGLSQRMTAAEANIKQNTSSISTINANVAKKQNTLTAGTNITISGTTINAKDTTYSAATSSTNGLMSKDDKKKLDRMTAIVVDDSISTTSTNVIQNKAVGLKFQGVDSELSGINSVLNSTADEIATIVNEYGSKNLLNSSLLANSTTNGITRKNNGDGSITYTGTSTLSNNILAPLMASKTLKPGTYIFSANATTSTSYSYQIYKNKTYWKGINITKPIEITESAAYTIGIVLGSKASINNTFKPMLRYASIKDDTYVPYAMTNKELTEKVADTGWITATLSSIVKSGTIKYRKIGYIVNIRGNAVIPKISSGAAGLFTLPDGYKPSTNATGWMSLVSGSVASEAFIHVQTSGSVEMIRLVAGLDTSAGYNFNITYML